MKILVTGSCGKVGEAVVRELLETGHHIRALDRTPPTPAMRDILRDNNEWAERFEMHYESILDPMTLLRAAEDCEAIIHLAAIPHPNHQNSENLTAVNVVGTQLVYAAAEAHGIKRVALASSCCVFGMVFARHAFDPHYLPLNDDHPRLPQDLYGLSKLLNEETAEAYWRRAGISSVCLRLTGVMHLTGVRPSWYRRHLEWSAHNRSLDLWTYVDDRDAARAFRLSVEKDDLEGNHNLIIAARDSYSPYDIRALFEKHCPNLVEYSKSFAPRQSAYDTSRAEEVLGWVAAHSWRDTPDGQELLKNLQARDDLELPLAE